MCDNSLPTLLPFCPLGDRAASRLVLDRCHSGVRERAERGVAAGMWPRSLAQQAPESDSSNLTRSAVN